MFPDLDIYSADNLIQCGPISCVYDAHRLSDNHRVALKVVRPNKQSSLVDSAGLSRLIVQARNSHHNNLVIPIIDASNHDFLPQYIVMPYVDFEVLYIWRERNPMVEYGFLLRTAISICQALEAVHKRDMIHGCPSPQNIFISGDNILLTTFSLTQITLSTIYDAKTPLYYAPEHLSYPRELSHISDVYVLGATLFFLFTRHHHLAKRKNAVSSILTESSLSLRTVLGVCPTGLDNLLNRMLEKDPTKRPQTVASVRAYLETLNEDYAGSFKFRRRNSPERRPYDASSNVLTINLTLSKRARASLFKLFNTESLAIKAEHEYDVFNALISFDEQYYCSLQYEGSGNSVDEHKLRITLLIDEHYPSNIELTKKLGKQLVFDCLVDNNLTIVKVLNIHKLALNATLNDTGSSLKLPVRLTLSSSGFTSQGGIPAKIIDELRELSETFSQSPKDSRYWQYWDSYLDLSKKIAENRAYDVELGEVKIATNELEFSLEADNAPWEKIADSIGQQAIIQVKDSSSQMFPCEILSCDIQRSSVRLSVETSYLSTLENIFAIYDQHLQLVYEDIGDLVQVRRQKETLEQFKRGFAVNPRLKDFLLDPSLADIRNSESGWQRVYKANLLHRDLNQEQLTALEAAQNTIDLLLINGPPGTGKTTLIAELCFQFVCRGWRVLLSSQSNLAVDKALATLPMRPPLMPLRVGNPDSIELDGSFRTSEHAARQWLEQIRLLSLSRAKQMSPRFESAEVNQLITSLILTNQDIETRKIVLEGLMKQEDQLRAKLEYMEEDNELNEIPTDSMSQNANVWVMSRTFTQEDTTRRFLTYLIAGIDCLSLVNGSNEEPQLIELLTTEEMSSLEAAIFEDLAISFELLSVFIHISALVSFCLQNTARKLSSFLSELTNMTAQISAAIVAGEREIDNDRFMRLMSDPFVKEILNSHDSNEPLLERPLTACKIVGSSVTEFLIYVQKSIDGLELSKYYNALKDDLRHEGDGNHLLLNVHRSILNAHRKAIDIAKRDLLKAVDRLDNHAIAWKDVYEQLYWLAPFEEEYEDPNYMFQTEFLLTLKRKLQEVNLLEYYSVNDKREKRLRGYLSDWQKRLLNPTLVDLKLIEEVYEMNANVIGTTCGQVNQLDQRRSREFEVVIIDEANKATPPELLQPLIRAKRIVLVGDHRQLPPMLDEEILTTVCNLSKNEPPLSMESISYPLFGRLFDVAPLRLKHMLVRQYRMTHDIVKVVNQFYDNQLTGGHNDPHQINVSLLSSDKSIVWISMPNKAQFFETRTGTSYQNSSEIEAIVQLLQQIHVYARTNQLRFEIGVITFYRLQADQLLESLKNKFSSLNLRIGTVDRFQGMEEEIIIVSLVRNNSERDIGFASSPERINVALSRAKKLLIIVGSHETFTSDNPSAEIYRQVVEVVRQVGTFQYRNA